ncbi:hypothetical protein [Candidatus Protofrankia datiscae]|uniref:hypothetical protein n=1 Tax=Candidatus Protofrankia datiscae TaxID=2716812 RepID=UPI0005BE569F|nr:hypothetical protein [Candidatus Protofrankia datiscae]
MTIALVACALGAVLSAVWAGATPSYVAMATGTVLIWSGIGFGVIAPTMTILDGLPPSQQGLASALNDLTRELGAALGIAITGSVFNTAYRHFLSGHDASSIVAQSPATALSDPGAQSLDGIVRDAVLHGWHSAFLAAGGVLIVCALGSALLYPRGSQDLLP